MEEDSQVDIKQEPEEMFNILKLEEPFSEDKNR